MDRACAGGQIVTLHQANVLRIQHSQGVQIKSIEDKAKETVKFKKKQTTQQHEAGVKISLVRALQ